MRRLCLILCIVAVCKISYSQDGDETFSGFNIYHKKGDDFFNRYEFEKAIVFYNRAYKKDTSDYLAILKQAEAYSKLNLLEQAEECYRIAINSCRDIDNEYLLKYALALLVNKKYEESKHWLRKYNQLVEDDIRGETYLETIENRAQLYKDSTIYIIQNVSEINTPESEINPILCRNQLIFASSKAQSIDMISSGYYDIFSASYTSSGELMHIDPLNISINSSFHEGPSAISGNQSLLFITRNIPEKDSRNKVKLGIFITAMPNDVNERVSLSAISIKNFKYSIGHPAVNYDGTIMYFISNAPDGIGGLDIYKSKLLDGEWSYPENLGNVINTKGDEMFPYIYNDTVLYFASDGHGGLGGMDIFKVNLNNMPLELINLGYPLNSRFDDFSLFPRFDEQTGYFCSNRRGGQGSDDIYKYDILNFKIKGSLLDAESKTLLEDAKISVFLNNGEEYLISETEEGEFEFSIIPGESYTLIIEKEDYKAEEIYLNEDVTMELRKQMMIELEPLQKTEIRLEAGQKYNFISGNDSLNNEYNAELDRMVTDYINKGDSISNVTILSKQMKFSEDGIYSMQLIKDPGMLAIAGGSPGTLLLFNADTLNITEDSVMVTLPGANETHFKLQTDLSYTNENYSPESHSVTIDKGPVFAEEITPLTSEEQEAIKELEWLLNLSINTTATAEEDSTVEAITADGFSIIPRSGYTLKVGRRGPTGDLENELEIPLTGGVKYNFSSDPAVMSDYRERLKTLLEDRRDIAVSADRAIDISLLSKELEIKEGEKFAFSLLPDSMGMDSLTSGERSTSTIYLNDKIFEVTRDEKFQINVPYTPERKVNINTDIDYLQENYQSDEYTVEIDTIPFFSEILIATTGLHERYQKTAFKRTDKEIIPSVNEGIDKLDTDISYRVQIVASRKPLSEKALRRKYSGNLEVKMFEEEGWYKYYIVSVPTYFEAKQIVNECGVKDAFIAAYEEGNKMKLKDAMARQYRERMERSGRILEDSIVSIVTVNFEFDKFSLRVDEENYLQELVIDKMKENAKTYVTINGHTDIRGSDIYNYGLSDERAKFVKDLMIRQGIEESRIKTFSFGETQVLKACDIPEECDESVHRVNRRVEIVLFLPTE